MGTRQNPGRFDCHAAAADDEPTFVLLARDRHAPILVQLWAALRELDAEDPDKVAEARQCAEAMQVWSRVYRRITLTVPNGTALTVAAALAERIRQVDVEMWSPDHDDTHDRGEMARAAACYAAPDAISHSDEFGRPLDADGRPRPLSHSERRKRWSYVPALRWPWDWQWFKRATRRRDLVKAAALILAEIERLDREAAREAERAKALEAADV